MAAALPWIRPRWSDKNGKPLAGGKVFTYHAGGTTPIASYTDSTGLTPNTNPVILDADGYGDIWLAPGSYKIVLKDKNDVVLWTKDKVKPADGGGGGIVDSDYVFEGYSQLLNGQFGPSTGLMDTLAKIIRIVYTPPTMSFSASGAGTIREKGTAVTASTLTASVTKKSDPIGTVRFYKGGTLLATQTTGGAIPAGGNSTYAWTGSFTDNTTFSAQADDDGSTGGPTTISASQSFTFVYPYFYGVGAAGLNAAAIAALTKDLITSTATLNRSFTVNGSQKMYFAYPSAYGALTQILDVNNFDTLLDWTRTTKTFTANDASSQSYYCYEFNNFAVAGTYPYTFKR